jgi:predicted transcriptional regulator
MSANTLTERILSNEAYRHRTIAIAKGEYTPRADESKVWFESLKSLGQVLRGENQHLLKVIIEHKPQSLTELETLTLRAKSNLSRTLKTLERYGIVELVKSAGTTRFSVEFGIDEVA